MSENVFRESNGEHQARRMASNCSAQNAAPTGQAPPSFLQKKGLLGKANGPS
jgi:hypothetical protein